MARYIDIEPYEMEGDSHCIEWRAHSNIHHVYTKDIPTANVIGREILNPEYGGKITKYFCPHCNRFKSRWSVESETIKGPFPTEYIRKICKHCGDDIIEITEEFERLAIATMLSTIIEGKRAITEDDNGHDIHIV